MKQSLRSLAEKLGCRLIGSGSITVTAVASLQSANKESLVFVEDTQHLDTALRSAAAAIIAGEFAAEDSATKSSKPILISAQARLAFARAERLLARADSDRVVHPSAIVAASAKLGKKVAIGAGAIIGERTQIGD